jgi:UDP-N-acetyl-D-glucosamine dehydrogenase
VDVLVPVSSPEIAEMSKLVENSFRFTNISFVNEIALLCDRIGISPWEVLDAAATKPFAFMLHDPGPGVGGHCIPVVPYFLEAVAEEYGMAAEFIEVAGRINDEMPHFVTRKLERLLELRGKRLSGARILVLGVAYKADVADCRESPALKLLEILSGRCDTAVYYDPYVPEVQFGRKKVPSLAFSDVMSSRFDAAVLVTPHHCLDYRQIAGRADFVLDTRDHLRDVEGLNAERL